MGMLWLNDPVALYANSKQNPRNYGFRNKNGNRKETHFCTHYNIPGHTVDKCYKLHGYVLGYKHKGKGSSNANQVLAIQISNFVVNPNIL